jgi:hypothetical protein
MATSVSPTVRVMIVCDGVLTDPRNPKRVTLVNLVSSIRPTGEPAYPHRQAELGVFVQLTECRGPGRVRVEIGAADSDEVVFSTPDRLVAFPNDPLGVHGLRFRILRCRFPAPGLYWVEFWYDNRELARQPIVLS